MKKKILIILGHPSKESFCHALSDAYKSGAISAGSEVREIKVGDLNFNPNLAHGYRRITELEDDLVSAQNQILWAEHLVFVYPTWWWTMPALLKGFVDRVFLPGFGFKYSNDSIWWDKLLIGKTARLIVTMDAPVWYYWFVNRGRTHTAMKKMTLEFCGIKPVRTTTFGSVKRSTQKQRLEWLEKVLNIGKALR